MKKGFLGLIVLLVAVVVPLQFAQTGGNLQPLQTFVPVTQTRGDQQ